MSTTADTILTQAGYVFNDTGRVYWTENEGLAWINAGQKAIVRFKPDANPVVENIILAAGIRQSLPAGRVALIDAVRNMGADGVTPGGALTRVDQHQLVHQDPQWPAADQTAEVDYFVYDERVPTQFLVSPPADGTGQVEIISADTPADLTDKTDNIVLADIYVDVLVDFVLYRGFAKNTDAAGHHQQALSHYQAFLMALGRQDMAEQLISPNIPAAVRMSAGLGGGQ